MQHHDRHGNHFLRPAVFVQSKYEIGLSLNASKKQSAVAGEAWLICLGVDDLTRGETAVDWSEPDSGLLIGSGRNVSDLLTIRRDLVSGDDNTGKHSLITTRVQMMDPKFGSG